MATQRPFWKGYLKLSLVTCKVAMIPVKTESEKVRFHTINRRTGERVQSRYVDAITGAVVEDEDEARGYARSETEEIILEDEDLDSIALDSTRTIDIETFVDESAIPSLWYDRPHYLIPDDKVGAEAFAVIREAMKVNKTVGISRLVLYRRERAVLVKPSGTGMLVWTLRYGEEVRDAEDYFDAIEPVELDPKLKTLIGQLIKERTRAWPIDLMEDPLQDRLLAIIKEKQSGRKRKPPAVPQTDNRGDNVIDLMAALKQSLKGRKG